MTTVGVVGGARSFGGDHGRAERSFRRALFPEAGAVVRFFDAAEDKATDAIHRLLRVYFLHAEYSFG